MRRGRSLLVSVSAVPLACLVACGLGQLAVRVARAADNAKPASTDPAKTDDDFPLQGEYVGEITYDGQPMKIGVQVIALGDGAFDVVAYPGGLPGAGWTPPNKITGKGTREGSGGDAIARIEGTDWGGVARKAEIRNGALVPLGDDGSAVGTLPKVVRTSPTLGAKPPEGAVVIFDGSGPVDEQATLVKPRITDDGLLMEGVTTKESFGDATWHIEFRLPYRPKARGQGRGNSGAYFLNCYEVQMLDSFGLEGRDNECGGIYSVKAPSVNMCFPPLEWQTYDVDVTAPRFEDGRPVKNARLTVRHNGVVVQDDVEVRGPTTAAGNRQQVPTGPLHLQNHGNPVRYRNIWVLPAR